MAVRMPPVPHASRQMVVVREHFASHANFAVRNATHRDQAITREHRDFRASSIRTALCGVSRLFLVLAIDADMLMMESNDKRAEACWSSSGAVCSER